MTENKLFGLASGVGALLAVGGTFVTGGMMIANVKRDFDDARTKVVQLEAQVTELRKQLVEATARPISDRTSGERGPEGPMGPQGIKGEAGVPGSDGREIELQSTVSHLQWRYAGGAWVDLVALDRIGGSNTMTGNGRTADVPPDTPAGPRLGGSGGAIVEHLRVLEDSTFYATQDQIAVGVGDVSSANAPFRLDGKTYRLNSGEHINLPTTKPCQLVYDNLAMPFDGEKAQAVNITIRCAP